MRPDAWPRNTCVALKIMHGVQARAPETDVPFFLYLSLYAQGCNSEAALISATGVKTRDLKNIHLG